MKNMQSQIIKKQLQKKKKTLFLSFFLTVTELLASLNNFN